METNCRWSAILVSYNAENTIRAAIEGILSQSLPPTEVLIVDDASTDETRSIVEDFARHYSQVRTLFIPKNTGGASAPRNLGILEMSNPYGVFFDDDDVSHEQRASTHIGRLDKGFDFSYVGSTRIGIDGRKLQVVNDSFQLDRTNFRDFKLQVLLGIRAPGSPQFAVPSSVLAFNRKAMLQIGGFDENLKRCEDIELALRALRAGYKIDARGEVLVTRLVCPRSYKSKESDILSERVVQLKSQSEWSMRLRVASLFHHKCRLSASRRHYLRSLLWGIPLGFLAPEILRRSFLRWRAGNLES